MQNDNKADGFDSADTIPAGAAVSAIDSAAAVDTMAAPADAWMEPIE